MLNRSHATIVLIAASLLACDKKDTAATPDTASSKKDPVSKPIEPAANTATAAAGKGDTASAAGSSIDRSLTNSYGGDEAGATALVKAFLDKAIDRVALTRALRPDPADYRAIFEGDAAAKAEQEYKKLWDTIKEGIGGKPDQTEIVIDGVATEDIAAWSEKARKNLPGGYEKVKDKFKKGLVVYRFKFVAPGEKLGMANDGLIHVNGHWVFVPKPWKALGGE
jgi:hypothetical protein